MKHIKSLTAILVILTLVLASCGGQTPVLNDATSSTNSSADQSTDSNIGTEGIIVIPTRTPPTVTINSTAYQDIDLRVETDLAKQFKVTHPSLKNVKLTVTSDKDGVLFNGAWNIDPTLFTPSMLKRTFATPGTRAVTVTARAGILLRTGTFYLNVINTAPVIKLHYDGSPHVGEYFWMTAQILDKNEPDGTKMCANTTWTVDAEVGVMNTTLPRALPVAAGSLATGCRILLNFKSVFGHQVRVSTHDTEGIVAVEAANLTVLPAYTGPRLNVQFSRLERKCKNASDDSDLGGTFNQNDGCEYTPLIAGQRSDATSKYHTIWSMFVTDDQGKENLLYTNAGFDSYDESLSSGLFFVARWIQFGDGGGTAPITRDCRIAVKITNLDGSIGTLTAWVGKCTYKTQKLN